MFEIPEIDDFKRIAEKLVQRNWAEANAGNLSVRINDVPKLPADVRPVEILLPMPFPGLDEQHFLVTATKSRARDIPAKPEKTIGLVQITANGTKLRKLWGAGPPTSEFPAHLAIHDMCIKNRPEIKAILHTHPPYLIAMSHLTEFHEIESINTTLRKMHPEVGILVPDGIGVLHYDIPGTVNLGLSTRDALSDKKIVIWQMHGVVSIGVDLDSALDNIEIMEKAAMIYLISISTGEKPIGLSDAQIAESRKYWGIKD